VLEPLEAKKCYDFSGCCLDRNEITMAESCADATMLEGASTNCDGGRVRKCHFLAGEDTGDDRVPELGRRLAYQAWPYFKRKCKGPDAWLKSDVVPFCDRLVLPDT
jgi:hypothetical protein